MGRGQYELDGDAPPVQHGAAEEVAARNAFASVEISEPKRLLLNQTPETTRKWQDWLYGKK